jgi:HEAT repeat protein
MRKRLVRIILSLVGVVVLGLIVRELVRPSEPVYQGRSVTGWINVLGVHEGQIGSMGNRSQKRYVPTNRAAPTKGLAMDALRAIGPPAVPYLAGALGKQDGATRNRYLKFYLGVGPRLRRFLPEPSVDAVYVRSAAAAALSGMLDLAKPAWPALLAAVKDAAWEVREPALRTLKALSEREPDVNVALCERLLTNGLPNAQVVQVVEQYGLHAPRAIRALVRAAKDGPTKVREAAITQLRVIGRAASDATPYLLTALTDPDRTIRCRACQALGAIQPDALQVVPILISTLNDPDELVRAQAANALAVYGPKASAAVPRLKELFKANGGVDKYCSGRALTQIDPAAAAELGLK